MHTEKSIVKKGLYALALSLACSALAGPSLAASWPMFLKDPSHSSIAEKAPLPPYSLKWRFMTKGPVYASPVVYDQKVFAGSYDKNLYALNASTGALLWSYPAGAEILSTPAAVNDRVYFGSKDGKIYALDASSGKLVWSYETGGGVMSSPTVADGVVYVGSMDLYLYALDAATGKRLWRVKLLDNELYSGIYSSPMYSDKAIVIAGKNGTIYSVSAKSGGKNWSLRTRSAIYSSPAVSGSTLYVSSYDRTLYAIDMKKGKISWRKNLENDLVYSSPVLHKDRIYIGFKSGHIKAFRKNDGSEAADYKFPSEINATPVLSDNGVMLVGCEDGTFYAVDPATGAVMWRYSTNGGIHASAAVTDNAVYAASKDGGIYAFAP